MPARLRRRQRAALSISPGNQAALSSQPCFDMSFAPLPCATDSRLYHFFPCPATRRAACLWLLALPAAWRSPHLARRRDLTITVKVDHVSVADSAQSLE